MIEGKCTAHTLSGDTWFHQLKIRPGLWIVFPYERIVADIGQTVHMHENNAVATVGGVSYILEWFRLIEHEVTDDEDEGEEG